MPPEIIAADDASASTAGLISDDRCSLEDESRLRRGRDGVSLSIEGRPQSPSSFVSSDDEGELEGAFRRKRYAPYLPAFLTSFEGSLRLACLSRLCFLLASVFYVKLSFVDLAWVTTIRAYDVPAEVLDEDDDDIWEEWAASAKNGPAVEDMRDEYYVESKLYYVLGAAFFALVGVLDCMRYCDVMNVVMILAGLAGVASGLADTSVEEAVWDFVSVHLYLLEGVNLLRREHDHGGMWCFRLGDVCFLAGSVLDCVGSYFDLAGLGERLWALGTDLTACLLWLACSLIDIGAEIYYLRKRRGFCCVGCTEEY